MANTDKKRYEMELNSYKNNKDYKNDGNFN